MSKPKTPLGDWLDNQPTPRSDIAAKWGISEPFLSQIANGKRRIQPGLADTIEADTGIDLRVLLGIPKKKREAA